MYSYTNLIAKASSILSKCVVELVDSDINFTRRLVESSHAGVGDLWWVFILLVLSNK